MKKMIMRYQINQIGNKRKYYTIATKAFKKMLLKANTDYSDKKRKTKVFLEPFLFLLL